MISASVGDQGKNQKSDVLYVQQLLNKHPFSKGKTGDMPLKEDGACGKKTIAAIRQFQAEVVGLAKPDGRIDPGGKSIKALEERQGGFSQTPLAAGVGVSVKPAENKPANSSGGTVTPIATVNTDPRELKTRSAIAKVYGSISEDKKWSREGEFMATYTVPAAVQADKNYSWVNVYNPKKPKVISLRCHKAMHPFLDAAFKNLVSRNLLSLLTEYGGCHVIRATRGTTNWSAHSWGLAIDVNMTGNGLGQTPSMDKNLVKCFTDAGFGWGGNYSRPDGMHFTLAGFDMPAKK
ncbi:MAG: M15 family metallopeptidase [Marinagarivorans sp.]